MGKVTRRWWLVASLGAPLTLGLSAQALRVRLDGDDVRIAAPQFRFLSGKPLEKLDVDARWLICLDRTRRRTNAHPDHNRGRENDNTFYCSLHRVNAKVDTSKPYEQTDCRNYR